MKWEAQLRGVNLDEEKGGKKVGKEKRVMFRDPKEYETLTPEEKREETRKMMQQHMKMFNFPKGG